MVSNAIGMRREEYKVEIRFFQTSCGRGNLCPGGDDLLSGTAEDQEKEGACAAADFMFAYATLRRLSLPRSSIFRAPPVPAITSVP